LLVRTPALAEWLRGTRERLGKPRRGVREVVGLAAQLVLAHPELYRIPASVPALKLGEMVYHPAPEPRPISFSAAAILPSALAIDRQEVASRRAHATELLARVNGSVRLKPVTAVVGGEPGYLRLACVDRIGDTMPQPSLGALRGYPLTLRQHQPLQSRLAPREIAGKGSDFLRDRLFTLPTHSRLGREDISRLAEWAARRSHRANSQAVVK
jgi:hypothetical protein